MHFLCLHGLGTNSSIFETQLAAIKYELGDHHTYEFVDGSLDVQAAEALGDMANPEDEYFAYCDFDDYASCMRALDQLERYLETEGPFDGVIGFSQGAVIAAMFVARRAQRAGGRAGAGADDLGFKCAVFFSAGGAYDPDLLGRGVVRIMTPEVDGEIVRIPTAHIWGAKDAGIDAQSLVNICAADTREVYIHDGEHDLPGVKSPASVKASVRAMRRVISMATYN